VVLARRGRDRPGHARPLLLDPHAPHSRRDLCPDRTAPVPRRAARGLLPAVVEGGGRRGLGRRAGDDERSQRTDAAGGAERLSPQRRGPLMSALDERRALFQRYKHDVKERGKPFYPYAMFHDTVMSLVVVTTIIVLAVIWKFTLPDQHDPTKPGWLGPLYDPKADPGTTTFVPRPDWYFYFLFYLLRIFKWPDSVILGTVGIPTIALILLLALPF